MGECRHHYAGSHPPCPHPAVEGGELCLWHNPKVRKHDPYVPALLEAADRTSSGDLDGFHLAGLSWGNAALPGRSLRNADLRDAQLDNADLTGADLTGATLRRASLKRARLAKAVLTGVDLSHANLSGADLREADLRRAVLNATVLNGADLSGADLGQATITGFQWNELSRFAGIRGIDEPVLASEDDDTRVCATPLAAGANAPISETSALNDPDPEREATRTFSVQGAIKPAFAAKPSLRSWLVPIAAAAAGLMVGTLLTSFPRNPAAPSGDAQHVSTENQALKQQGEAYARRIHELEESAKDLLDGRGRAVQDLQQLRAEAERLREDVQRSSGEAARLRGSDDRAALLQDELDRVRASRDLLGMELKRQLKLGAILTEGVQRLESDSRAAVARSEELASTAAHVQGLAGELGKARDELQRTREEREAWKTNANALNNDLAVVRQELARYLARVQGTSLQDYLTTDTALLPMIPVQPGQPVALGGDYCLTLRVDPGSRAGTVQTALTVQRPSALANPDVAVLLYDQNHQLLRRLAWSFPHVDGGAPVVSASSMVACDRFPAFVQVLVSPALETARR